MQPFISVVSMRSFGRSTASIVSNHVTRLRTATAVCLFSAHLTPSRSRSSRLVIANRKRVEMFVGKRFHLPTRLRTAAPDIAAEWCYKKNAMNIYPEIVGVGHMEPVWWVCRDCGHSYAMSVEKRVVRGGGCSECARLQKNHTQKGTERGEVELLPGEQNLALRAKRPTLLNLRTKY